MVNISKYFIISKTILVITQNMFKYDEDESKEKI